MGEKQIFVFENPGSVFTESCTLVGYPCDRSKYPVPNNCSCYFECVDMIIYTRQCAAGTGFGNTAGDCVDDFYSNCSCPLTSTSASTSSVLTTERPADTGDVNNQEGTNKAPIIAGCVCAVIAVLVICVVIFVLLKRKSHKNNQNEIVRERKPENARTFCNPDYNEDRASYISIAGSQLQPPFHTGDQRSDEPPDVPERTLQSNGGQHAYDNNF